MKVQDRNLDEYPRGSHVGLNYASLDSLQNGHLIVLSELCTPLTSYKLSRCHLHCSYLNLGKYYIGKSSLEV